ncbi:dermonecrotic toxin domain-containing protein [Erwinia piriflorinigrans]|uniref:Dermonecrotic toxin (DNT) (PMT) (Mitogenic toxin) n=1 Tax=Erwinia piriflorinigrans CFBP 5888 TaxID=1161919 RepID=V5ZAH0_9GAMM|nr:DUF6543 domain-containing protein [Erwinia piriflorinigrans]CCG88250.1 Dermonecrotic toxin (DNT) (PMT) (Mitogenic toxin) [Erwinia piriflorinigrans CFBP 5888]
MKTPANQQHGYEYSSQKTQDEFVKQLANQPGLHSGNTTRQNLCRLGLHYLSSTPLSFQSQGNRVISGNKTNLTSAVYPHPHHDHCPHWQAPPRCRIRTEGARSAQREKSTPSLQDPHDKIISISPLSATTAKRVNNGITGLLNLITGCLYQTDGFINYYDPLKIPMAEAAVLRVPVQHKQKQRIIATTNEKFPEPEPQSNPKQHIDFMESAREALAQNYENYYKKFPSLKNIAATLLQEKIKQRFHLNINPDETYFVHFKEQGNNAGKITFFEPLSKKTLTQCLFTNFDSDFWDNYVWVDAISAIYDASYLQNHSDKFDFADRINIDATKFADLVWSIDFYGYAKEKLVERYSHKDEQIKHLFIKFIHHLDSSQLDNESAGDILSAVGLTEDNNVTARLFAINGYTAANAFVFKNRHTCRVTLYFPKSKTKLISFRDDFELRRWVVNACGTQAGRAEIASHFSFANRQDGLIYKGIDTWLNTLNNDSSYLDRIMTISAPVSSTLFFAEHLKGITDKALSDLKLQVKSDARVSLQMWEEAIDASNIIPNPISPFLSLAVHIGHMISAVTYKEKMQEWSNIKNDAVNILMMIFLDKVISFPDMEGYEFIGSIKKVDEKTAFETLHKRTSRNGLSVFEDVRYIYHEPTTARGLSAEEIERIRAIDAFLPIRKTAFTEDILTLNRDLNNYISHDLQGYPYDFFCGLGDDTTLPSYIKLARKKYRVAFASAKENLAIAISRVHDISYEKEIKEYLAMSLNSHNDKTLSEAIFRLKEQLRLARDFLSESEIKEYDNIVIVSTRRITDEFAPVHSRSRIEDQNHLKRIPLAFTFVEDPLRRIFIMLDSTVENNTAGSSIMAMNVNYLDSTILHEASHLASDTLDICYNEIHEEIFLPGNTRALRRKINDKIESGDIKNNIHFNKFMREAYRAFGIDQLIDSESGLNIIKTTPMLKSNLIMDNADTFVAHIKRLANMNNNKKTKREADEDNAGDADKYRYLGLIFIASAEHSAKNASSKLYP